MVRPTVKTNAGEMTAMLLMWGSAGLIVSILCWILFDIVLTGASELSAEFLTAEVEDAGRAGGIGPVIISTVAIVAVAMSFAVPLSVATAIALTEHTRHLSRSGRLIRRSLDVLAAVPSIVFGLFGNAFFCVVMGLGYSIWSGGLTLACMALPIMIRTSEQAIRSVPNDYRFAAAALGLSRTTTTFRLVLPSAAAGVGTGIVLGVGRALAETAALIFTSGYVTRMPESLSDSGRSLSVHIYDMAMNVPGGVARACATAIVLVASLFFINLATEVSAKRLGLRLPNQNTGGRVR